MIELEGVEVTDVSTDPKARIQAAGLIDIYLEHLTPVNSDGVDYFARNSLEFILGAYYGDQLVGTSTAKLEPRRDSSINKNLYIRHLVTDSDFEGKAVGRRLVGSFEGIAGLLGVQSVRVAPTRDVRSFYEELGYEQESSTGSYYKFIADTKTL